MKKSLLMTLLASSILIVSNGQTVTLFHYAPGGGLDNGSTPVTPCTDQSYFVSVSGLNPAYQVCSVQWQWQFAGSGTVYGASTNIGLTIHVTTANVSVTATPIIGLVTDCSSSSYLSSSSLTQQVATQTVSWSSSNALSSCGSSQTYSINPINCAVSYNYYIYSAPAGTYFTGTSSQSITATTATSVGVTFPAGSGGFGLTVSPNYADGTTGPEIGAGYSFGTPSLSVTVNKYVGITAFISTQNYAGYNYTWTVNGSAPNGGSTGNSCEDELICGQSNPIHVVATNACGTTSANGSAFVKCGGGGGMSITPNPTFGNMKVTFQDAALAAGQSNVSRIKAIQIVDLSGKIVKKFEFGTGVIEANITTAGLSPNIYILHVFDGKEWTHREIIVK